ncbi:hypothetical protein HQ576_10890 [bacterium]|nr:hypothetical protein [bacterium]
MDHLTCDVCGKALLVDETTRYEARIQVYAAYDPMEIVPDDLAEASRERLRQLIEQLEDMDPQDVEDSVYKDMLFDLCPTCQKHYLANPLPRPADDGASPRQPGGKTCPQDREHP